jgi:hypothetical protein
MIPLLHQHRAWLAPLLTLIVILLLLVAIFIPLHAKQSQYSSSIQKSQPRIERVQGLLAAAPQLENQLNAARTAAQMQLYPNSSDENRLNTELQTRLRSLAQQSGLTVGSLRALPTRKELNLDVLLLNLNLQGGLAELQRFLDALQRPTEAAPALRVDNLILRRASVIPNAPQTLTIDITVAALRPASNQTATP